MLQTGDRVSDDRDNRQRANSKSPASFGLGAGRDPAKEDATRITIGQTGRVMSSLNNLVIALIRQAGFSYAPQARRWFAAHLSDAFALLTTPFSLS
jgi:hypothetical protein